MSVEIATVFIRLSSGKRLNRVGGFAVVHLQASLDAGGDDVLNEGIVRPRAPRLGHGLLRRARTLERRSGADAYPQPYRRCPSHRRRVFREFGNEKASVRSSEPNLTLERHASQ